MFDFNNNFDFNKIYESKMINISLDDFTDDEEDAPKSIFKDTNTKTISDYYNFDMLLSRIFDAIGKTKLVKDNDGTVSYITKRVNFEGAVHNIAYISIKEPQGKNKKITNFNFYIDLNEKTKELEIGNCSNFSKSAYLNITYPLIKICEMYFEGPVYINSIYVDIPYGYTEPIEETLNKIKLPFTYQDIRNVNFYRCDWNGKKYWYPFNSEIKKDKFAEVNLNVKLSHDFIEHFAGIKNTILPLLNELYYNAFNSFDDFKKVVEIICGNGGCVITDLETNFNEDNFIEELNKFKKLVNSYLGGKEESSLEDNNYKTKIELILPDAAIQAFENINRKEPNTLSIFKLFKERKSKDIYRKFDLPVIEQILKENGINIEDLVIKYEKEWEQNFYKFGNLLLEHINNLKNLDPSYKSRIITNILWYGTDNFNYKENGSNEYKVFDGLTPEECRTLFDLLTGLKNTDNMELDETRLLIQDENDRVAIKELFTRLCYYPNNVDNAEDSNITMHEYNKFVLLLRFLYLLGILATDYYNKTKKVSDAEMHYPNIEALYDMTYNHIVSDRFSSYTPYSGYNINMQLNTYEKLYKFIYFIAYIIENGYNIKIPFLGFNEYNYNNLLKHLSKEDKNPKNVVNAEFDLNNIPNMELLNTKSISLLLTTIFTNIDKKI